MSKPFRPRVASWAKRLEACTPGILALGYDPTMPRSELLYWLTQSEQWNIPGEVWTPTSSYRLLGGNAKMEKSTAAVEYKTRGVSLSPDLESGMKGVCAGSGQCASVCLAEHGQYVGAKHQRVRIKKTLYMALFPDHFINKLENELHGHYRYARSEGLNAAARLNVLSDVPWERVPEIMATMSTGLKLYDYTKLPWSVRQPRPDGYKLTYSLGEARGSLDRALDWMFRGGNAAVVVGPAFTPELEAAVRLFNRQLRTVLALGGSKDSPIYKKIVSNRWKAVHGKPTRDAPHRAALDLPKYRAATLLANGELWGKGLVDGDLHDARFDDDTGKFVVLYAKGPAIYDTSGFVVRIRADGTPVEATRDDRRANEWTKNQTLAARAGWRQLLSPAARMHLDPATDVRVIVPGPHSLMRLTPQARVELAERKKAERAEAKALKAREKARKKRNAARRKARKRNRGRGLQAPPTRACFSMPAPWGVDPWGNKVGDLV
tara:strand:- start:444 stop:1916 length:1473 start_codon:yes stop_codon:yes gene_type:complete